MTTNKKRFISWTGSNDLHKCERNQVICEGNNMDELIEDYCKKNEISLDTLKEDNGEWSNREMPIYFCPLYGKEISGIPRYVISGFKSLKDINDDENNITYHGIFSLSRTTRNPFNKKEEL